MKVYEPQHSSLVPILAAHDERVREAYQAHRQAVDKAAEAIDAHEEARAALSRAPRDAERAGMEAARAGKPVPKTPDITTLAAREGHARQVAADAAKITRRTARDLDTAVIDALPVHAAALADASEAVAAWEQARATYQAEVDKALAAAGRARAIAGALLVEYGGDPGRAVARDLLPALRDEADLPRFAQPLDVLAMLDERAKPRRHGYSIRPHVDDIGAWAGTAAAALRASLGQTEQATP